MNEQQYYKQIKELIETYEVNSKVRYIEDNHEKLQRILEKLQKKKVSKM